MTFRIATALLVLLSFAGCQDFDNEWKKKSYKGAHFDKLVVVGLSHEIEMRAFYENETIKGIREKGYDAIEGLSIFPQEVTELDHNQDKITELIIENEIDGVLIIKILHENDQKYMMPADYSKFKKFYFRRRSYHTYASGYYSQPDKYYMIGTLYDLKENHEENEETVVWRGSSTIINPDKNIEEKKAFIGHVVDHITDKHLIK